MGRGSSDKDKGGYTTPRDDDDTTQGVTLRDAKGVISKPGSRVTATQPLQPRRVSRPPLLTECRFLGLRRTGTAQCLAQPSSLLCAPHAA